MLSWVCDLLVLVWHTVLLVLSCDFLCDVVLLSVLYLVGRYVYVALRSRSRPSISRLVL